VLCPLFHQAGQLCIPFGAKRRFSHGAPTAFTWREFLVVVDLVEQGAGRQTAASPAAWNVAARCVLLLLLVTASDAGEARSD